MSRSSLSLVSPTPSATNADVSVRESDSSPHIEFLALTVPVIVIVIVTSVLLGAYRRRSGYGNGSLCQAWRRRIYRRRNSRHQRSSTNHSTTALRKGSSTMLVEELNDINTDVWDADCDCLEEELGPKSPTGGTSDQHSLSSSRNSHTGVCTVSVEVHSDPPLDLQRGGGDTRTLAERRGMTGLTLTTCTDEDVSTQALDISSSTITSPSYYSAQSTSVPSLTSQNTDYSSETLSSSTTNESLCDVAQEIVDVVQSEDFATDTAEILQSNSSQFSIFTSSESRDYHTPLDRELSIFTPTRVIDDSNPSITPTISRPEPEQMIIPLHELDGGLGSSIMWENWDQELHTML